MKNSNKIGVDKIGEMIYAIVGIFFLFVFVCVLSNLKETISTTIKNKD